MSEERSLLSVQTIMDGIDWAYSQVVSGVPGTVGFEEFVASYLRDGSDPEGAVDELIAWQTGNAGVAGFVTNLGGLITLPVAIPANLASTLFLQLRMIAAIAKIMGHDPKSDQVKSLAVACLAGAAAVDVLKDVGIKVGAKMAEQAINQISREVIVKINQAVGFRLLTKFGAAGAVNLWKLIPILGGMISGAFDATSTRTVGYVAKSMFPIVASNKSKDGPDFVFHEDAQQAS